MTESKPLFAISPIDGRYFGQTRSLANYFSEYALMKYRVRVEILYLIFLNQKGLFQWPSGFNTDTLRAVYEHFSEADAQRIKNTEQITNHDVKAVEYFVKEKMEGLSLSHLSEWVHFGLTSQDINHTAQPLALKAFLDDVLMPILFHVQEQFQEYAFEWKEVPMLARTHGQPASPTTMGREWMVFADRLHKQLDMLRHLAIEAKFGGATGGFNAHYAAFPEIDWNKAGDEFVSNFLGLHRQQYTTQIEQYDMLAAMLDNIKRICVLLLDFCRDIWQYISLEYFKQKIKDGEVGSSAMPHKVNPIDFENAEGNLGICIAMLQHLSEKLPVSRLQRDLSDSTVQRNLGVPFAHLVIALKSIQKGLGKLVLQHETLQADLEKNTMVIAEGIQTILRREAYPHAYEALKKLTRTGQAISLKEIHTFIETLDVSDAVKLELKQLTPHTYTGKAPW